MTPDQIVAFVLALTSPAPVDPLFPVIAAGGVARGTGLMIVAMAVGTVGSSSFAQPVPPPADQISADCNAAVYATDQLVCSDATLHGLDAEMLHLWARAGTEHRLHNADRAAQLDWFRHRSLCAFKADHRACAIAAYRVRIEQLRAMFGDP